MRGAAVAQAGHGGFPWIDPFSNDLMTMYVTVQTINEENQELRTRLAEQEQELLRTRIKLEHLRRQFRGLREEADRVLREWGRDPDLLSRRAEDRNLSD